MPCRRRRRCVKLRNPRGGRAVHVLIHAKTCRAAARLELKREPWRIFDNARGAKHHATRGRQVGRDCPELIFQRAVQSYLWSLPAINIWSMKEASEKQFGAGYNILPTWKKRINAKTLVTTPNSDLVYAMSYLDLAKYGPLVVEAPPGVQGMIVVDALGPANARTGWVHRRR